MTRVANVFVTIEFPDGEVRIRHWTGKNARAIHKAARAKYPGASLQFGNVWYQNYYGAH